MRRAMAGAMLAGVLSGACASGMPPATGTPAADVDAPVGAPTSADAPSFLGLPLTGRLEDVRRGLPELSETRAEPDGLVARGTITVAQLPLRTQLTFYEGRLAQISSSASDVSLERFEALVASLERELGPGLPTVCTYDGDGVPLADYLRSGHGSVSVDWRSERLYAGASLHATPGGGRAVHVHASWLPSTSRHAPDDFFKGARRKQAAPPSVSAASACPEVGPSPPRFHGVPYGASPSEALALLGGELRVHETELVVPHRIGGVDGELTLRFYDGCMATVFFAAPGTLAAYRAIAAELLEPLGAPERRERCSPTGDEPTDAQISAQRGSMQTLFSDERFRGSVRLSRHDASIPAQVVVDVGYRPLAHRAPRIDFAGP